MKICPRCNRCHVGALIYATPMTMLFLQQSFEQWCDMHLKDTEIGSMSSLPLFKERTTSSLRDFLAMVNVVDERMLG